MFLSRFRFQFPDILDSVGRAELLIRDARKLPRVHFSGQLLYLVSGSLHPRYYLSYKNFGSTVGL